ncbi:hypothetical protein GQ600_17058 [Phytophthora cactorum]|nr:hypothetical protein GQ600_17058 [Phytophthora cactorum]
MLSSHIGNDVLVKVIPTAKTVPQIAKFAKRQDFE